MCRACSDFIHSKRIKQKHTRRRIIDSNHNNSTQNRDPQEQQQQQQMEEDVVNDEIMKSQDLCVRKLLETLDKLNHEVTQVKDQVRTEMFGAQAQLTLAWQDINKALVKQKVEHLDSLESTESSICKGT